MRGRESGLGFITWFTPRGLRELSASCCLRPHKPLLSASDILSGEEELDSMSVATALTLLWILLKYTGEPSFPSLDPLLGSEIQS